jgi:hypothetical protein
MPEAVRILHEVENSHLQELGCPDRAALAARISFWLGVAHAAMKQLEPARERFASALDLDPEMSIDAAYFAPAIVALFDDVRRGQRARPSGSLSLATDPEGAAVFVDGRPAGATPLTVNLAAGDHLVCARRLGTLDWAARLRVQAGKVDGQNVYLQRAPSAEISAQLAPLLAGQRSRFFSEPSQVEAVGRVAGAEWVASVTGPATLQYRSARHPEQGGTLTGSAAELTDGLQRALLPTNPERRTPHRYFEASAGVSLGSSEGVDGALVAGARFPLSERWAICVDLRGQLGSTRLVYLYGSGTEAAMTARRPGSGGLSLGARFAPFIWGKSSLAVSLSAAGWLWWVTTLEDLPGGINFRPISEQNAARPALGGTASVSFARDLGGWSLVALLEYALAATTAGPVEVMGEGSAATVRPAPLRHEVTLRVGFAL